MGGGLRSWAWCCAGPLWLFLLGHDKPDGTLLRFRRHHYFADRLEHLLRLDSRILRRNVVLQCQRLGMRRNIRRLKPRLRRPVCNCSDRQYVHALA